MTEATEAAPGAMIWPLVEEVCAPIDPENACGEDAAYNDDYQRMKEIVDALSAASGSEVDFKLLVDLGTRVLTTRSKDLRAAAFLVLGLERTRGGAGLAEGLAMVDTLARTYWDDMYPALKRMAGRQNALQLLSDRLKERVASARFDPEERAALEDARLRLKSLQQFTLEAMEERAPALSGLVQAIEEALRKIPAERTDSESEDAARPAAATPSPPPAGSVHPVARAGTPTAIATAGPDGDFRSQRDALRAVERGAAFLREQDPTDPVSYLLLRAARWGAMEQAPPNEAGRTLIPPIPAARREALERIATGGDHRLLVEVAEEVFVEAPLLLDAQRYLVQGMGGIGAEMKQAQDAVLSSLAVLLRRVEQLPDLSFNDGTPFADGATREWIETRVKPLFASTEEAAAPSNDGGSAVDEAYAEALAQLDGGGLQQALRVIQQGSDRDWGARDRFRRRFLTARLCMRARQFALARPMLEGLDAEIDRLGLADWEPSLAVDAWRQLHQCLGELVRGAAASDEPVLRQSAERIFDKICRVDPSQALGLLPGSKR